MFDLSTLILILYSIGCVLILFYIFKFMVVLSKKIKINSGENL